MKYSLRSLMIVVLVGPQLLAAGWWAVQSAIAPVERAVIDFGPATPDALDRSYEQYLKNLKNHR
jgi:hypothetical protein